MRRLNGVDIRRFNRRHRRTGHVFQERYESILVQKDGYLLELSRHVSLNPLQVQIVKTAGDWP